MFYLFIYYFQCRCSVRNDKKLVCPATVIERGGDFRRGKHGHNHAGKPGHDIAAEVSAKVISTALEDVFRPASQIVEAVVLDRIGDHPLAGLPNPTNLARRANRARQKQRPKDPTDLDFDICQHFLPEGKFSPAYLQLLVYTTVQLLIPG